MNEKIVDKFRELCNNVITCDLGMLPIPMFPTLATEKVMSNQPKVNLVATFTAYSSPLGEDFQTWEIQTSNNQSIVRFADSIRNMDPDNFTHCTFNLSISRYGDDAVTWLAGRDFALPNFDMFTRKDAKVASAENLAAYINEVMEDNNLPLFS